VCPQKAEISASEKRVWAHGVPTIIFHIYIVGTSMGTQFSGFLRNIQAQRRQKNPQ